MPTDANFLLFGPFADPPATWQALLDAGVLVRDVSGGPGLAGWLRVSAGTAAETTPFLVAHWPRGRTGDEPHRARAARATKESDVSVELDLDGSGQATSRHRGAVLRPHGRPSSASTAAST